MSWFGAAANGEWAESFLQVSFEEPRSLVSDNYWHAEVSTGDGVSPASKVITHADGHGGVELELVRVSSTAFGIDSSPHIGPSVSA